MLRTKKRRTSIDWPIRILLCALLVMFSLAFPSASSATTASPNCIETDRWLEIDLYWFKQGAIEDSAVQFWNRFQPLFAGLCGYRGAILNIGWTVGPVMEWTGNLDQRITLPGGLGESEWVDELELLTGTTAERQKKFDSRFASPTVVKRHGYDPWTYGDLKRLATALRSEADRRGIPSFKVGMLNYAWTNAYGEEAQWAKRHPEAFAKLSFSNPGTFNPGRYFDPGARLHSDSQILGGLLHGIAEGTPAHLAYAAQWGSLSKAVQLDAIMLRDSFGVPLAYQRGGPWGSVAPTTAIIRRTTKDVSDLVRETKLANPKALVMMYSGGASAVSDWRSNGFDLERVAKQGYLDIWVDQTWAGAWNEVGTRRHAFWNSPTKGWTYQLAYMLTHAAILAHTRVRHYPLTETFDAWESWDVIHTAPGRLRWGIWAYSHAAVKTPTGLKFPAGSYVSWANQGERLLSEKDVAFLADNLDAAASDTKLTTEVMGPTLVYSRDAMKWEADHASPTDQINEWIDEQIGSVIKWPLPIFSATRLEWLPTVHSDLFLVQTPTHLPAPQKSALATLIRHGQPVAILGNPAGGIDAGLARLSGLDGDFSTTQLPVTSCRASSHAHELVKNSEIDFTTWCYPHHARSTDEARVLYEAEGSPDLLLNTTQGKRAVFWNPPDLRCAERQPLSKLWQNRGTPYALGTAALNELYKQSANIHADSFDLMQPMTIAAWRIANGRVRILAGNLEEGLRDDADMVRHVDLDVPESWAIHRWKDKWTNSSPTQRKEILSIELPQESSVLFESER